MAKPLPCCRLFIVALIDLGRGLQYEILASIKRSCLSKDVLAALMTLAGGPLSHHPRMSEADHQVLQ
eukprot:gene196-388_t